jgi:hypothetical protein
VVRGRHVWERVFDSVRVIRQPDAVHAPPVTEAELDAVEAQLGTRLPHTYREFLKRFGTGELVGWVGLYPVTPRGKRDRFTLAGRTLEIRDYLRKYGADRPNYQWLTSLIYFANSGGGDEYAWDPAVVTNARPHECQFYYLRRHGEDEPVRAGESFLRFIEWVDADVRSFSDPEQGEPAWAEVYFCPAYLRAKKKPQRREVLRWLQWNNRTVLGMATSIRDGGRADLFPVLADALEEAGCTNPDLLAACRGLPAVDGAWALRVLLGKEA